MEKKDMYSGWKDRRDVHIPPAGKGGFKEDIIIRKEIAPIYPLCKAETELQNSDWKDFKNVDDRGE